MSRVDRLFEIIQILRGAGRVVTAQELSEQLEVSVRTIYRDIQALQAMRTPIDGEAGVGYLMRSGYDLPPINFTETETEAIVVGLNMLTRTGDPGLQKAAKSVARKIESVRENMDRYLSSDWGVSTKTEIDLEIIRSHVRENRKLKIWYSDGVDQQSERTVLPLALIYYIEVVVLAAWCELRNDFRHFRIDRINGHQSLNQTFKSRSRQLLSQWKETHHA